MKENVRMPPGEQSFCTLTNSWIEGASEIKSEAGRLHDRPRIQNFWYVKADSGSYYSYFADFYVLIAETVAFRVFIYTSVYVCF